MFAIIDIETCGGRFDARRGRIIEICVLKHDGLSVVEKFSTLINPECYITPQFTKISGITNEMVSEAPKFYEVAKQIIEITSGCIFVAHNVQFDYGFVREEFAALGYTFKRDTLCTVRLSRKLIPGFVSYSLGNLCAQLGIEIENRHRAEGDAVATSILFDRLMLVKSQHPVYKKMGIEELMATRKDKIKSSIVEKLPEGCGVYYFRNQSQEIIYVGKSTHMRRRAQEHFQSSSKKSRLMQEELYAVDFVETGSELIALILESIEIKKHRPKFNRLSKSSDFSHAIGWQVYPDDVIGFELGVIDAVQRPLVLFPSYLGAKKYFDKIIENQSLCLSYCGIQNSSEVCFNHQIQKCKGICANKEPIAEYNVRARLVLKSLQFANDHMVILVSGRQAHEVGFVVIHNQRFSGFGYIDRDESVDQSDAWFDYMIERTYFPDIDQLIKSYLNKNKVKILPFQTTPYPD